jgi:hypothetical protein
MSYQGKLTDSSGVPINGNTAIQFSLYSAATGGTALWSENYDGNSGRPIINVVNGHFTVELGSQSALLPSLFSSDTRYLGIKVGSDSEMSPRVPILSVPFSLQAEEADKLDGVDAASFYRTDAVSSGAYKMSITVNTNSDWVLNLKQENTNGYGLQIETAGTGGEPALKVKGPTSTLFRVQGNGNVGVGVNSATEKLEVDGTVKATAFVDSDGNPITSVEQIWNRESASDPAYFLNYNVGIGTKTPSHKLTLSIEEGDDGIKVIGNTSENSYAVGALLELEANIDYRARGVALSHRNKTTGDKSMWFMGVPYTGNGFQISASDRMVTYAGGPFHKDKAHLFINEDGQVGIGTTSPGDSLHVNGNALVGNARLGNDTYSTHAVFQHKDSADYGLIQDSNGRTLLNADTGQPINLRIGNETQFSVEPSGKVVVGDGSNRELLSLNSERSWVFEARYSGASTELLLRPEENNKFFSIVSQDSASRHFSVRATNNGDDASVSLLSAGGSMFVGPDSKGDARLNVSGNARIDGTLVVTAVQGSFSGDGSNLSGLNASSISSGTLDSNRLPVISNSMLASGAALDNLGGDTSEVEELFLSKAGVWKAPTQLSNAKIVITEDELKRSDDKNLILDGLAKQVVFKTTGQTKYEDAASGVSDSAFLWMYGGDESYHQMMRLNNLGEIWTKKYGILQDYFMTRTQGDAITNNVTFGTNGFGLETDGVAKVEGINIKEINATGAPGADGFRMRYDVHYFGDNYDAVVFEKTDGNAATPDGGMVFGNTGNTGTFDPAMVIKGDGKVGMGTTQPSEKLHVNGTALFNKTSFKSSGYWEKMVVQTSHPDVANSARLYFEGEDSAGDPSAIQLYFPSEGAGMYFNSNVELMALNASRVVLGNNAAERLAIETDGDVTIAKELSVNTIEIRGGADLAEKFNTKEASLEPGTVMVIDPAETGRLKVSSQAHDRLVAGVVSGARGLEPGVVLSDDETLSGSSHPIALAGRVWVKASHESGTIKPGDLLTTANKAGHVMKVTSVSRSQGAILGKAMSEVQDGMVLVLVSLQ